MRTDRRGRRAQAARRLRHLRDARAAPRAAAKRAPRCPSARTRATRNRTGSGFTSPGAVQLRHLQPAEREGNRASNVLGRTRRTAPPSSDPSRTRSASRSLRPSSPRPKRRVHAQGARRPPSRRRAGARTGRRAARPRPRPSSVASTGGPGGDSTIAMRAPRARARSPRGSGRRRSAISWDCCARSCLPTRLDAHVGHVRPARKNVVAHEAVEVHRARHRRRRAGDVASPRARAAAPPELARHRVGALQRRRLGHVDHHLQLVLVVERQHLERHRAQRREQRAPGDEQRGERP